MSSFNIREDETILKVVRKSLAVLLWPATLALLYLALPIIFYRFFLQNNILSLIFYLWIFCVGIYFIYEVARWYFDVFVITDKRLINVDQGGLLKKTVIEIYFSDIKEVKFKREGLVSTLFNFGSIQIQTEKETLVLEIVPEANKISHQLKELSVQARTELNSRGFLEAISKIKEEE